MQLNTLKNDGQLYLATQYESFLLQKPSPISLPSWNHASPWLRQKSARRKRVFPPLLFHKIIHFAASDKLLFILNLSIPPTGSSRWIYQLIQFVAPASHGIPTSPYTKLGKIDCLHVCVTESTCMFVHVCAYVYVQARKGDSNQEITLTQKSLSTLTAELNFQAEECRSSSRSS